MQRSSVYMKLSGVLLLVVVLALAGAHQVSVQAGPNAQATTSATIGAVATQIPPCQPAGGTSGTSGGAATMSATSSVGGTGGTSGMADDDVSVAAQATPSALGQPSYLGVRVAPVSDCGIQIVETFVGGPAQLALLQADDIIVAVNGTTIKDMMSMNATGGTGGTGGAGGMATAPAGGLGGTPEAGGAGGTSGTAGGTANQAMIASFFSFVQTHAPGEMLTLTVQRAGQQLSVQVTLAAMPSQSGTTGGGAATATPAG